MLGQITRMDDFGSNKNLHIKSDMVENKIEFFPHCTIKHSETKCTKLVLLFLYFHIPRQGCLTTGAFINVVATVALQI